MPEPPRPESPAAPAPAPSPKVWLPGPLQQGEIILTGMFLLAIVGSVVLQPSTGSVTLFGYELPPLCLFRAVTGWRCPGCGLTRSFTFMGHGMVVEAFRIHRLGPLLYVFSVGFLGYRLVQLARAVKAWRARQEG
ncbi:MAG: DUF2752 domain-containing protein [Pseudomonadota bacterium]